MYNKQMSVIDFVSKQLNISLEFNDDTGIAHLVSKDAFMRAKKEGKSPKQLATEIVAGLKIDNSIIKKIEVAGAGFINIFLTDDFLIQQVRPVAGKQVAGKQVGPVLEKKQIVFEQQKRRR